MAYEQAKRALEEQERVVVELRSRAWILIGAADDHDVVLRGSVIICDRGRDRR